MNSDSTSSVPLGELVDLQRGTTYKSALLDRPGPALLGLASIQRNGGFRGEALRTYGGESPEKLLLRPGDLYVSLKDVTQSGDLLGAVARVPPEVTLGRLTQDTVKLLFRSAEPPRDYVYWILRTPQYREHCRSHATGVTTLGLPRDDFLAFGVPEATAERLRVLDALIALDDKIEHDDRLRVSLFQTARALFGSAMGRRVPVGEVAELAKGLSYKGAGLGGGGLPMFNLANFTTSGWLDRSGVKYYSGEFKDRHVVHAGDLLVANTDLTQRRAILGQPLLVPGGVETALFTHHLYALRFKERVPDVRLAIYFALQTSEFRGRAESSATGTTVTALPRDALLEFEFVMPDPPDLDAMNQRTGRLIERAWAAEEESVMLRELRDALLPKLVSGAIRVPERYEP